MEGRFVPQELAEIVRDLFLAERTGYLDLSKPGGPSLTLEFGLGMLQYAEGDEDEELGRRLVREGKLSSGALADVIAGGATPRDLAQALVQRGWIAPSSLADCHHDSLTSVLSRAFRWEAGEFRFREGQVPPPPVEPDVLRSVDSYLHAISTMSGFPAAMQALLSMPRPLVQKPGSAIPIDRLNLTPVQGFVLSRLDGSLSLAEILSTLPPHEEEPTCRFVYALLLLGAVAYEPPMAPGPFLTSPIVQEHARERAREKEEMEFIRNRYELTAEASPYSILGVLEGATWNEVEEAYRARKDEISPQRFLEKVHSQMRSEFRILEGRLVQSYLSLQSSIMQGRVEGRESMHVEEEIDLDVATMRREMTKTEVKVNLEEAERQAEIYYQKAKKYYQQGDFYNCVQYCTLALKHCEPVARFHHLMGEAQVRNPDHRWQKLAEQAFHRAVELDPWNADYLVTLGQFYRRQGLSRRARRHFEKALEILPTHAVALEELAGLKG